MIRVKICGINDPQAFDAAVDAGADWVGFVFFPPSPRFVTAEQVASLSARTQGGPGRVGLFVDPDDATVAATLAAVPLDVLQVHAAPDRAAALRLRFGIPVWRAIGVASPADLPSAPAEIDGYLIEAKPPAGATRPGGNAVSFDWTLTRGWAPPLPWLLAGGLTPANVAAAIAASGVTAVDVSSGVERMPGVKDPGLIRQFVANARSA